MRVTIGNFVTPVKGLTTVIGATLLLISLSIDFSYGKPSIFSKETCTKIEFIRKYPFSANLNTYVISYLRSRDKSVTYADWIFVSTSRTFVTGILMPFMGKLETILGSKHCIFIGCLIYT